MSTPIVAPSKTAIAFSDHGVQIRSFEDAYRFASAVAKSGLAPKGMESAEKCLVALQAGMELGFSPMRALSAVVVVNGRASLMGEAALAKIRESKVCSHGPIVGTRGEGEKREGFMRFQRHEMSEAIEVTFTMTEAKRAGLWGKTGPWTLYSDDMLCWRAVARACKRYFSDVLLGLLVAEEAQDYRVEREVAVQPVREAAPDPLLLEVTSSAPEPADEGFGPCPGCERSPDLIAEEGHRSGCPHDSGPPAGKE